MVPVCRVWLQTWEEQQGGGEGLCEVCSSCALGTGFQLWAAAVVLHQVCSVAVHWADLSSCCSCITWLWTGQMGQGMALAAPGAAWESLGVAFTPRP